MSGSPAHIEVVGLTRLFGDKLAVDALSLKVSSGEIYGLVGPDGAGKTTTLRMLVGLLKPTRGNARLLGVEPLGGDFSVREALGYMPQQYSLYGDLTVDENLAFFSEMFCLGRDAYRNRRERLLALTRLEAFGSRRADALSGGMYKKLALACALLHEPKVLVLDEPTNGVDPVSRREFWDLLHDFLSEGMAIILATPYMDEAARCHRAGLLYEGRLLEEGRPSEMLGAFRHPVLRVQGERKRIVELIENNADVLAFTPAGAVLRVVAREGREASVRLQLERAGAQAVKTEPTFEDLFLARVHELSEGEWEERA
ncbi:MAG: ABC transporter ATP-binding protein [Deltaproteobacteria bacterium]|nr:ABC transporter ATP-binding protein [Deltaproteobacteria bacterium]